MALHGRKETLRIVRNIEERQEIKKTSRKYRIQTEIKKTSRNKDVMKYRGHVGHISLVPFIGPKHVSSNPLSEKQ